MPERLTVDEFLASQPAESAPAFTIEPLKDDPESVRITPWTPLGGCQCAFAVVVPKSVIDFVERTGDRHRCCGRVSQVVTVRFKEDASIRLDELFRRQFEYLRLLSRRRWAMMKQPLAKTRPASLGSDKPDKEDTGVAGGASSDTSNSRTASDQPADATSGSPGGGSSSTIAWNGFDDWGTAGGERLPGTGAAVVDEQSMYDCYIECLQDAFVDISLALPPGKARGKALRHAIRACGEICFNVDFYSGIPRIRGPG